MNPMLGEATATIDGTDYHLVMNNAAWIAIEDALDMAILELLQYLGECAAKGRPAKNKVMRAMLWGATRAHHAELTIDQCGDLVFRFTELFDAVATAAGKSLQWADADDLESVITPGEAQPGKAPARQRKTTKAGTGTRS